MEQKIYVLEDDDGIRFMIHYLLEEEGYQVKSFPGTGLFINKIREELPDLVVMDIWLPDGDGRKVCRELRLETATSEVKTLMMTAQYEIGKFEYADDFIPKPFDIDDFLSRIRRLLKN